MGEIEFDSEAKVFYGNVVNPRDTITFQSDNAKLLEKEFCKSVDSYLEFCRKIGESPEKPYSGKFVLRLSPQKHSVVALAAQIAKKSLNAWASYLLVENAEKELKQV